MKRGIKKVSTQYDATKSNVKVNQYERERVCVCVCARALSYACDQLPGKLLRLVLILDSSEARYKGEAKPRARSTKRARERGGTAIH